MSEKRGFYIFFTENFLVSDADFVYYNIVCVSIESKGVYKRMFCPA